MLFNMALSFGRSSADQLQQLFGARPHQVGVFPRFYIQAQHRLGDVEERRRERVEHRREGATLAVAGDRARRRLAVAAHRVPVVDAARHEPLG